MPGGSIDGIAETAICFKTGTNRFFVRKRPISRNWYARISVPTANLAAQRGAQIVDQEKLEISQVLNVKM